MHVGRSHGLEVLGEFGIAALASVYAECHCLLVIDDAQLFTVVVRKSKRAGSVDLDILVKTGAVVFRRRPASEIDLAGFAIQERLPAMVLALRNCIVGTMLAYSQFDIQAIIV